MRSLLAALVLLLAAPCARAATDRAVWMWEKESYAMLESRSAAKDAISFFKARGINTLYLYADSFQGRNLLVQKPRLYRRLIRRLRGEGIRTYALLGSAYLNTEEYVLPARHPDALAMLKRVLDYNAREKERDRFEGVNLDIEPHILDQWKERKTALLLEFLSMSRKLMDLKKAYKLDLAVGPAVPFWLDGITLEWEGRVKPVSEHAADVYDYLALMDYRDRAEGRDGIIAHAASELKYAAGIGRKVIIGVETGKNEIEKVSFYHLKAGDMERELALTEKAFAPEPAFGGFVIHHYRTYRNWLESQNPEN
ncbi:MAG: hypothetical protein PHV33_10070 [Elusimicrobiales bacterium]|nr:hypothetical protein [Elusimicrobiales bacterium]